MKIASALTRVSRVENQRESLFVQTGRMLPKQGLVRAGLDEAPHRLYNPSSAFYKLFKLSPDSFQRLR